MVYSNNISLLIKGSFPVPSFNLFRGLQGFPLRANARPRRTVWLRNGKGTPNGKENGSFGRTWFRMVVYF